MAIILSVSRGRSTVPNVGKDDPHSLAAMKINCLSFLDFEAALNVRYRSGANSLR